MKTLPSIKRKKLQVTSSSLVETDLLAPNQLLPLVLRPAPGAMRVDLNSWAADHKDELEKYLTKHGGLLFRGFDVSSTEQFESFARAVSGELLGYEDRATPRSQVKAGVFSSTDYPADQSIELHNENCYATTFPGKVFFYCMTAARAGGATPVADCRQVHELISPEIRQRFASRGVMYVRNFMPNMGLSWQEAFQTEDRELMERYCREADIQVEWCGPDHLRTRQLRPALARHPRTGERIWFNQAVAFHITTVEAETRRRLLAELGEQGVPKNAFYGDGEPIEESVLTALRQAYRHACVSWPWREGDILLLDNLLVAHGREPFEGPRKVVVSMTEPVAGKDVWIQ